VGNFDVPEPTIIERDALAGHRIAVSVSESADLARLGLTEYHCRLVVAEVSRAIMLAGGIVIYGGNLSDSSYTRILIDEAQRFGKGAPGLEIVLDESTHRGTSPDVIDAVDRHLGEHYGRLFVMEGDRAILWALRHREHEWNENVASSLTAMRMHVTAASDARLVVGGKLVNYRGSEPGVIEEARLSAEAGKPLLIAGGYGGAAAALLGTALPALLDEAFSLPDFPAGIRDVADSLDGFGEVLERTGGLVIDLEEGLGKTLALSHRPADLATTTVQLLASCFAERK
jgi:hypothetical protein